jgi:hypothetical protein
MLAGALLHMANGFCASDPRDQVFALWGLVNHILQPGSQFGVVGYTRTALELHTTATCEILTTVNWMELLSLGGANSWPNSGLPSWALDLTRDEQPSNFIS